MSATWLITRTDSYVFCFHMRRRLLWDWNTEAPSRKFKLISWSENGKGRNAFLKKGLLKLFNPGCKIVYKVEAFLADRKRRALLTETSRKTRVNSRANCIFTHFNVKSISVLPEDKQRSTHCGDDYFACHKILIVNQFFKKMKPESISHVSNWTVLDNYCSSQPHESWLGSWYRTRQIFCSEREFCKNRT